MSARPAFALDVGGTLTLATAEAGTASAASVALYDEHGADVTPSPAPVVTIAAGLLSAPVSAAVCDALGDNYRAAWSYTIAATVYADDQTFRVVRRVMRPRLTAAQLVAEFVPLLASRGASTHAALIATAWGALERDLDARGKNIHLVRDYGHLRDAHAWLSASLIAASFAAGGASTAEWLATSEDYRARAVASVEALLSAAPWYDADDDLVPGGGEQRRNLQTVTIGR